MRQSQPINKTLDPIRKSCNSPCHESLPPLPQADCRHTRYLRILRNWYLRHEAAAVLLGHLPIKGEAEAGQNK
jgi:hypothetical protein